MEGSDHLNTSIVIFVPDRSILNNISSAHFYIIEVKFMAQRWVFDYALWLTKEVDL